ncbi:MAG: HD domain-containing protein [Desulfovibrionaceae bacterium]
MNTPFKEAVTICKTLLRNGYDAHVINAPLQQEILKESKEMAVDIACEPDVNTLVKLFPDVRPCPDERAMAVLEENGIIFRFYALDMEASSHPELAQLRVTPTMMARMPKSERLQMRISGFGSPLETGDKYEGFANVTDCGEIRLLGLPDETLRHNYLLAVRALRFAANFDVDIEPNTWLAIVRASSRVLDYVPSTEIMNEWRKVAAESMHRFVKLLFDAHILQGLIPEVAALACVTQRRDDDGPEETVFEHTLACMRHYPEGSFHHDWLGTMAMLFHDVGKLYTGEYFDGRWTFYQHHRVGAKVTRKILRRLHFLPEDIDLLCHLVRHHMRFQFMLTDRGIRRFKALDEYPRLIEMTRANIAAHGASPTYYNHNQKYLARADTPEQMLEPLLNGNQIMQETQLAPGPLVGIIREALLQAQIAGDVADEAGARSFVREYAKRNAM